MKLITVLILTLMLLCVITTDAGTWHTPRRKYLRTKPSWEKQKRLENQALRQETESIQRSFKKLSVKERKFLKKILWENYAVGYYQELNGLSHSFEVNFLREQSQKNLDVLKSRRMYAAILLKLKKEDKAHMLSHIVRRRAIGLRDAYLRNLRNSSKPSSDGGYEIKPGDLFYHGDQRVSPVSTFFAYLLGLVILCPLLILGSLVFSERAHIFRALHKRLNIRKASLLSDASLFHTPR